jgi:UDP-GlcNAc:undecaprenyl-phosphate/decaprenyl-phosphate GlcNAc-1-phosphate transferase
MIKLLPLIYFISPLAAFVITMVAIPAVIKVAHIKHLFDEVGDERKIHKTKTPNLGGIAIFTALIICLSIFINTQLLPYYNYLVASAVLLFIIGIKDDLVGVDPRKKFSVQFIAAAILTMLADIRIYSFFGVFGVEALPYWVSIVFSMFTIVFIINAFNLIDGIDGLAGVIGSIAMITFGVLFTLAGQDGLAIMSFTYLGCIVGFLKFNIAPARIFMGDTGSLLLGFFASVCCIQFINIGPVQIESSFLNAKPAVAIAVLIIPVFDTLRVFTLRLLKKSSPFKADKNHIHHRLIGLQYTHSQTVTILAGINISFILFALAFQGLGTQYLLFLILGLALLLNTALTFMVRKDIDLNQKGIQKPKAAANA